MSTNSPRRSLLRGSSTTVAALAYQLWDSIWISWTACCHGGICWEPQTWREYLQGKPHIIFIYLGWAKNIWFPGKLWALHFNQQIDCKFLSLQALWFEADGGFLKPVAQALNPETEHFWLVVYLPLWKIWVSWDDDIPNIWKNRTCSKPPTSIVYL